MENPGKTHWEAVKCIFRYLRGTPNHGLIFGGRGRDFSLVGFCDSNYAGDRDRRKSTFGYVFTIGGTTISWKARLQTIVALSTTEAELIAAKEVLYLRRLLCDLGFVYEAQITQQSPLIKRLLSCFNRSYELSPCSRQSHNRLQPRSPTDRCPINDEHIFGG